jgi:hypothetical protein
VLAGVAASGAAGTLSGVGTAAFLRDRETLAASVTAGSVELLVGTDTDGGATTPVDGPVQVPLEALDAGESAVASVAFAVPDRDGVNPAHLWLRGFCASSSRIARYLDLTVTVEETGERLFDGTLADFGTELGAGRRVDGPTDACVAPGESVTIRIEYALLVGYVGTESADVVLEAVAVQCRHSDAPVDPFAGDDAGVDCLAEGCDCCTLVGKLEVENDRLTPGTYEFAEGSSAYRVVVSDVVTNGDGEPEAARFEVVLSDDESVSADLCELRVKSARDVFEFVDEATDGVVGTDGKAISNVTFWICTPYLADGSCAEGLLEPGDEESATGEATGEQTPTSSGGQSAGGESGGDESTDDASPDDESAAGGGSSDDAEAPPGQAKSGTGAGR